MKLWGSLAFLLGTSANKIDWAKLTDFQTDFSIKIERKSLESSVSGHVQFDVFGKQLRVEATEIDRGIVNGLGPLGGKVWSELVIDVPQRKFSIRGNGVGGNRALFSLSSNYCLSGQVSETLVQHIPPKAALESMATQQYEPELEAQLQAMPHDVKNDVITWPAPGGGFLKIKADGTPITIHAPVSNFDLSFSNWQAGSGVITAFDCPTDSSTQLGEQIPSVAVHQILMELAQTNFANLVEMPEPMTLIRQHEMAASVVPPQLTMTVGAGVVGGMVGMVMLAKIFARKHRHTEPLLSDA